MSLNSEEKGKLIGYGVNKGKKLALSSLKELDLISDDINDPIEAAQSVEASLDKKYSPEDIRDSFGQGYLHGLKMAFAFIAEQYVILEKEGDKFVLYPTQELVPRQGFRNYPNVKIYAGIRVKSKSHGLFCELPEIRFVEDLGLKPLK